MYERVVSGPLGAPVYGPLTCVESAISFSVTGSTVAGLTVTGLGFKCEDDGETTWKCDDDASFISWGAVSTSMRNGINKCGSDGGDDVFNLSNAASDAFVTLWVR